MPNHAPPGVRDLGQDRELVARLVANEGEAWDQFYQGFRPRIGACVRRAGVRDEQVEDACSFVLEALLDDDCRRLRQWDGRARLTTYLYTVASRLAVDFIRQQPRVVFPGEEEFPTRTRSPRPCARRGARPTRRAAREDPALPPAHTIGSDREILLLRYYAGLAIQEIARLSGKTANAVHQPCTAPTGT